MNSNKEISSNATKANPLASQAEPFNPPSKISNEIDIKDVLHKELDMIQAVIARMASNSFQCKSWMIGLLTFVLALSKDSVYSLGPYAFILLLPISIFWFLDGFFLYTEQRFRDLYKYTVHKRTDEKYGTDKLYYDMNFTAFEHGPLIGGGIYDHWKIYKAARKARKAGTPIYHTPKINVDQSPQNVKTIIDVMKSKTLGIFYYIPVLFIFFVAIRGACLLYVPYFEEKKDPIIISVEANSLQPLLNMLGKMQPSSSPVGTSTIPPVNVPTIDSIR